MYGGIEVEAGGELGDVYVGDDAPLVIFAELADPDPVPLARTVELAAKGEAISVNTSVSFELKVDVAVPATMVFMTMTVDVAVM